MKTETKNTTGTTTMTTKNQGESRLAKVEYFLSFDNNIL